jgi:hypothetical protein
MLTHGDARRVKTVAIGIALASWAFSIAVGLFLVKPLRPFTLVALVVGGICMAIALLLGWTLFCPWCARRLFFVASIANSPDLGQLARQYAPYDIVVGDRMVCRHCHCRFALQRTQQGTVAQ